MIPGNSVALQHTNPPLGGLHQLLEGCVEGGQLKVETPLTAVPLLEPELFHCSLVLVAQLVSGPRSRGGLRGQSRGERC